MNSFKDLNNRFFYIAIINFICAMLLALFGSGIFFRVISFVFFLIFVLNMNLASKKAKDEKSSAKNQG
ncbi:MULTISPECIES: hypothetical protein [Enterococcus]|uniref:Uncharacterized protein n=1 Tax=Candidatus Enterococcus ferrettii TaxID=2815324 RepID=A0ABV0EW98_9ENTE|nr:hypothetical protein [Enterococcus sp. 665A]MBO1340244.1 hypothetical protein [Enterococcus sp. 665A]